MNGKMVILKIMGVQVEIMGVQEEKAVYQNRLIPSEEWFINFAL